MGVREAEMGEGNERVERKGRAREGEQESRRESEGERSE